MGETSILLKLAHQGNQEAREELIRDNLGLVHHVVNRYCMKQEEREDLVQIGTIGLIKAIDGFDDTMEVKLSTYAVPLILGEIRRYLRDDGMVKVSRTIKENMMKIRRWRQWYEAQNGKSAGVEEICRGKQLTREEVILALDAEKPAGSLYESMGGEEGKEVALLERVHADGTEYGRGSLLGCSADPEKEKLLDFMLIRQLLEELPDQERRVMVLRYFEDMTQTRVAEITGTSQVKISRMEKKIIAGMKQKVTTQKGRIH